MYVVFGANGNTGSVVASTLLERGKRVRAVGRDLTKLEALRAKGAEVVTADVLDAASVAAALRGAEGAYLLTPPDPRSTDLVGRGKKIIDNFVAGLEGVKHAVLLSSIAAQVPSGTGPIMITNYGEATLPKASGTTFTFLRAAYFIENILAFARTIKNDGVLPVFGGGEAFPFPMVATKDIGATAANALAHPPSTHDWIELSGPKEYSFEDAAKEATAIVGRPVKATAVPIEAMVPTMMQFGVSENVAGLYKEMTEAFGKGLARWEGKRAERGVTTLADVLRAGLR